MTSTMARKTGFQNKKAAKFLAAFLALCVWQLAAAVVDNRLLLVGPLQVAGRLWELCGEQTTWQALGSTLGRISLGFFLAFFTALVLAAVSARYPLVEILLRPYILAIQTVPVASFIVIALLWLSGRHLSVFISFLMVLPVLYANALQGFRAADRQLLEMARVFRVPFSRRLQYIYLPQVMPYFRTAVSLGLGLCWKAGAAAEVIGLPAGSVGERLYTAKVYFQTPDLFAWTVTIVAVSVLFERLFLVLTDWAAGKAGG